MFPIKYSNYVGLYNKVCKSLRQEVQFKIILDQVSRGKEKYSS